MKNYRNFRWAFDSPKNELTFSCCSFLDAVAHMSTHMWKLDSAAIRARCSRVYASFPQGNFPPWRRNAKRRHCSLVEKVIELDVTPTHRSVRPSLLAVLCDVNWDSKSNDLRTLWRVCCVRPGTARITTTNQASRLINNMRKRLAEQGPRQFQTLKVDKIS